MLTTSASEERLSAALTSRIIETEFEFNSPVQWTIEIPAEAAVALIRGIDAKS